MTYQPDPPADALTRASTIRALVSTFAAAEADTRAAFASLAAHEASLDAAFGAGQGRSIRISATDRDGASDWSPAGAERAITGMRRAAWQTIVERLELRRMLSIARCAEMGRALDTETPPPVTEENVQRFVARWAAALPQMVEEAIAEVFEWLRPREQTARADYKTNQKNARLEIGERVILTYMVEPAWRGSGYRLRYGSGASNVGARLTAMENVFSALDGRFRAACILAALSATRPGTPVIVHDFWDRPRYAVVLPAAVPMLHQLDHAEDYDRPGEPLAPFFSDTDIFISPGHEFRVVGGLVTNFHVPRSSLLMLVSAFAGLEAFEIVGLAIDEHHDVGVLLDRPRLAKVAKHRESALEDRRDRPVQLRDRQHLGDRRARRRPGRGVWGFNTWSGGPYTPVALQATGSGPPFGGPPPIRPTAAARPRARFSTEFRGGGRGCEAVRHDRHPRPQGGTMRNQGDGIEFGISMRLLKEVKAEAQLAESLGYDYLLTGEHISFHGPTPNTLISLSAAAAGIPQSQLDDAAFAASFGVPATSAVPMASPCARRNSTSGSRPQAMTVLAPLPAARLAARILVSIPPRPMLVPAPPAMASSAGSPARASCTNWACGSRRGSAVYKPFWSVRITSASASTRFATNAPRVSLSPNLISSLTTVSFSLITGTTPKPSSVSSVLRAFR